MGILNNPVFAVYLNIYLLLFFFKFAFYGIHTQKNKIYSTFRYMGVMMVLKEK